MSIYQEIQKILIKFILNKPVIGSICLRMKYEEAVIPPIGAIARPIGVNPVTNTIIYDPEQFKVLDISTQVLEFMLAHEALHLLTGSLIRRGDRDPYLWNIACDYEVNYLLHDIGFKVPKNALYSSYFHNKYYYAEKIYEILLKQAKKKLKRKPCEGDNDQKNLNNYFPYQKRKQLDNHVYPQTQSEVIKAKLSTQNALSTAAQIERSIKEIEGCGILPASLKRMIDKLMTPTVTWKNFLSDISTTITKNNYSYRRCHPYYRQQNIYVPTLHTPEAKVILIVDTSGSIGENELRLFISEVLTIIQVFNVTFLTCDAEIYKEDIVENVMGIEEILEHIKGGGGTEFKPAFQWIEENILDNYTVILMTDGHNIDKRIDVPLCIEQIVVLTTDKKPSGLEPDILIKVELHEEQNW